MLSLHFPTLYANCMLLHTTSQNHINYQNSLAMYKYSKDGISVLTVLDKRKVKKSGLFPIKVQVIYNRKQSYYKSLEKTNKKGQMSS